MKMNPLKLLTTPELAKRWNMHPGSIKNMRHLKMGPPYIRVASRSVRYLLKEVEKWEKRK